MSVLGKLFKKENPKINVKDLRVDLHSHLIPGIDDGSKGIEESIHMLKKFKELGFEKVITSPHVMHDFYRNTPKIINKGLEQVREELKVQKIDIEIEAAAEYYIDPEFLDLIEKDELLSFGKEKYVLIEMSFNAESSLLTKVIFDLKMAGFQPVLAHVERYPYYFGQTKKLREYLSRGVLFQLNINSLSGVYGKGVKKLAQQVIEEEMISFIGSDCHKIDHLFLMDDTLSNKYLHQLIDSGKIRNNTL